MEFKPKLKMAAGRFPDQEFFWNTCNTIRPTMTKNYIKSVDLQRKEMKMKLPTKKVIRPTKYWNDLLMKHDHVSSAKKNNHSIMVE